MFYYQVGVVQKDQLEGRYCVIAHCVYMFDTVYTLDGIAGIISYKTKYR